MIAKIPTRNEIKHLKVYVPGKPIEEVQLELGLEKIIKLASNENPYGCSPLAKEAMIQEMKKISLYPEGMAPSLARKIAQRVHVNQENILIGNGSDEIIRLVTRSYIQSGDEAIMADVTFPRYETNVLIEGGMPVKIPLIDGVHDLDKMYQAISNKTKIIFVCNPNNPTGTIVNKHKLQSFIEQVPKNILLVIDEAYYEYAISQEYLQTTPFLDKYPNLIILRTFSKIYGLAALRIGYGLMHPFLLRELIKVKEPFNTNRLAQAAAIASLEDSSFVEYCVRKNNEEKKILEDKFKQMNLMNFPSYANFIMIKLNISGNEAFQSLLQQGVIVRSGETLGYPGTIRVSIGNESENKELIQSLQKVLN